MEAGTPGADAQVAARLDQAVSKVAHDVFVRVTILRVNLVTPWGTGELGEPAWMTAWGRRSVLLQCITMPQSQEPEGRLQCRAGDRSLPWIVHQHAVKVGGWGGTVGCVRLRGSTRSTVSQCVPCRHINSTTNRPIPVSGRPLTGGTSTSWWYPHAVMV